MEAARSAAFLVTSINTNRMGHRVSRRNQQIVNWDSSRTARSHESLRKEAKGNTSCHDRSIILDSSTVWHVGASLNGFGAAAFMINRVSDDSERQRVIEDFTKWWSSGQAL
jgi:hypothetical protein